MPLDEYNRLKEKGKEQLNEGNYQKAVEYYTRALKEAEKLLENSAEAYSKGFPPPEIRASCTNIPEHDVKTCLFCSKYLELAVCHSNRAFANVNLKSYEAALLDSEEAVRLAPDWPKVRILAK